MVNFNKPLTVLKIIDDSQSMHYFQDFFNFFGNDFNCDTDIISPYYGKVLKINLKESESADKDNLEYVPIFLIY